MMQKRIFLVSAIAILLAAAVIRSVWMDEWERPSACACKEVFATDSAQALVAAKAMVGNAYYQYTLRVARIHCLKAYAAGLPEKAWQDSLGTEWPTSREFFGSRCP